MPATRSANLLAQYLAEAGNEDVEIIVFPEADHSLNGFMPAYWESLFAWLKSLQES